MTEYSIPAYLIFSYLVFYYLILPDSPVPGQPHQVKPHQVTPYPENPYPGFPYLAEPYLDLPFFLGSRLLLPLVPHEGFELRFDPVQFLQLFTDRLELFGFRLVLSGQRVQLLLPGLYRELVIRRGGVQLSLGEQEQIDLALVLGLVLVAGFTPLARFLQF